MNFGNLQDEPLKPNKVQWESLLLPAAREDVYADFPFAGFLKNYWADDETWPVVEQAVFYVYERVRGLPLSHKEVLSEKGTIFNACLLMAYETMQVASNGLYYLSEPLLKHEAMIRHMKIMSFLLGLFAPMVHVSESLALATSDGNFYDFKKTLVEFTSGYEMISDVGFVDRTIPKLDFWESFSSAMSENLMAMIETSVGDPTLLVAFKSLLKGGFAEMYQVKPDLFRVISIAENKMVRRILSDMNTPSSMEKLPVNQYLVTNILSDSLNSRGELGNQLH